VAPFNRIPKPGLFHRVRLRLIGFFKTGDQSVNRLRRFLDFFFFFFFGARREHSLISAQSQ